MVLCAEELKSLRKSIIYFHFLCLNATMFDSDNQIASNSSDVQSSSDSLEEWRYLDKSNLTRNHQLTQVMKRRAPTKTRMVSLQYY